MTAKLERRRREWRIELQEAAIERKALKERIALLEGRITLQRELHDDEVKDMAASIDNHRQAIERLLVENKELKAKLENK